MLRFSLGVAKKANLGPDRATVFFSVGEIKGRQMVSDGLRPSECVHAAMGSGRDAR